MSARAAAARPQTEQRAARPSAQPRPEGFERTPLGFYQQNEIEVATFDIEALCRIGHRMAMAGEEDSKTFADLQQLMCVIEQRARDLREVVVAGLASIDEQLAAQRLSVRPGVAANEGGAS